MSAGKRQPSFTDPNPKLSARKRIKLAKKTHEKNKGFGHDSKVTLLASFNVLYS